MTEMSTGVRGGLGLISYGAALFIAGAIAFAIDGGDQVGMLGSLGAVAGLCGVVLVVVGLVKVGLRLRKDG